MSIQIKTCISEGGEVAYAERKDSDIANRLRKKILILQPDLIWACLFKDGITFDLSDDGKDFARVEWKYADTFAKFTLHGTTRIITTKQEVER